MIRDRFCHQFANLFTLTNLTNFTDVDGQILADISQFLSKKTKPSSKTITSTFLSTPETCFAKRSISSVAAAPSSFPASESFSAAASCARARSAWAPLSFGLRRI